jgi:hypothetical protein
MYREPVAQWTLDVTIWHHFSFGHEISARVLTKRGGWVDVGTWRWQGLGIPDSLATDAASRIAAVVQEHLITRYGIQGELDIPWAGDPGPF